MFATDLRFPFSVLEVTDAGAVEFGFALDVELVTLEPPAVTPDVDEGFTGD